MKGWSQPPHILAQITSRRSSAALRERWKEGPDRARNASFLESSFLPAASPAQRPLTVSFPPNPAEQFVEKSSCAQPLSDLSGLEPHGDFSGSPSALCTEPLIPTTPIIPSEEMAKISCSLETKELWDKFHELGTEMIITKSGRYGWRRPDSSARGGGKGKSCSDKKKQKREI